jgi:OmpA-OmpF porin, OOP family
MNNALKHIMIGSLFIAAQSMTLPAFADEGTKVPQGTKAQEGYVGDSKGVVVTDRYGDCVKTGFPHPGAACVGIAEAPPTPAPPPAAVVAQTLTLSASALFDTAKSDLRPAGKQELDAVVAKLKGGAKVSSITVTGHTDSRGSEAYNQALSERRAASVKNYMVSQGVDGALVHTRGMGESAPVASNKTEEGRQQNRRVEIEIK